MEERWKVYELRVSNEFLKKVTAKKKKKIKKLILYIVSLIYIHIHIRTNKCIHVR